MYAKLRAAWPGRSSALTYSMKRPFSLCILQLLLIPALLLTAAGASAGERSVTPPMMRITDNATTHELALTGESERVFLFFTVYDIAHYADTTGPTAFSHDELIEDGRAKALNITFARKLGMKRIREEFAKTLKRNAQADWLIDAESTIAEFRGAIDRDTRAGDQLTLYWLAGGRVLAEFNGERAFAATDTAFAKLLWSIWFGENPVCDADDMLALLPASTDE
jgi:hypothetical protein